MAPKVDTGQRRPFKRGLAKSLRANATEAERKLWSRLRAGQVSGLHFRRQQPIGPYIADFFCAALKLVVEVDGEQHGQDAALAYDDARTQFLEARGYRVCGFPMAKC